MWALEIALKNIKKTTNPKIVVVAYSMFVLY